MSTRPLVTSTYTHTSQKYHWKLGQVVTEAEMRLEGGTFSGAAGGVEWETQRETEPQTDWGETGNAVCDDASFGRMC